MYFGDDVLFLSFAEMTGHKRSSPTVGKRANDRIDSQQFAFFFCCLFVRQHKSCLTWTTESRSDDDDRGRHTAQARRGRTKKKTRVFSLSLSFGDNVLCMSRCFFSPTFLSSTSLPFLSYASLLSCLFAPLLCFVFRSVRGRSQRLTMTSVPNARLALVYNDDDDDDA